MSAATSADGHLLSDAAGERIEFVRLLPHPRPRVWEALTTADERAEWFFAGRLEPREGAELALEDDGPGVTGRVIEVVDGTVLRATWSSQDGPDSTIGFEMRDAGSGTELTFTHHVDERCRPARLCAGWHAILDDLAAYLDEGRIRPQPGRHAQLLARYE